MRSFPDTGQPISSIYFSGGYSAGYYSYIWAEVLDKDAFNAFLETSLFDQKTALAFRQIYWKREARPKRWRCM